MPRKRAIILVNWFGEHANVIMTILAFGALATAIWTIVLYQKLEDQSSRLSGIEIARIVEARAADRNAVINCRNSIPVTTTANILIGVVKSDLKQRAATNRELALSDTDSDLKRIRMKAATAAEKKAEQLKPFPARTKKFCKDLATQLRADLVAKYGAKLAQLEKEERKSQKSDS